MYDQIREDIFFIMFYAGVTMMALIASCYLLLRRGNAFAPDITPPVRLRRWVAVFFACIALGHVWYLPTYFLSSSDDVVLFGLIGSLLDCLTFFPLEIVVLLAMLQDRHRPLWPVSLMLAPPIAGMAWGVISRSDALMPLIRIYFLLLSIGLIIYMVREVRRYGRWLRDNYADLEHKEVWQSFLVLAVIFIASDFYVGGYGLPVYEYVSQALAIVLICYLLWRVETLSDLSMSTNDEEEEFVTTENVEDNDLPLSIRNSIELLLQQHCIDKQLYLQHELNLLKLAKAIGTNRSYLSQYFSSIGINYNAYINDLRINHFVSLYHEAVASQRSITARQLALESGYRSYNTFREAFKRKTGQSVIVWMKAASEQEQSPSELDSSEREQARPEGKAQLEGHSKPSSDEIFKKSDVIIKNHGSGHGP
jgi:AraC-like DNA-binding protein